MQFPGAFRGVRIPAPAAQIGTLEAQNGSRLEQQEWVRIAGANPPA
jgi:hypothetical protein